jgi:ribose transport system substrate-binding protein
MSRFHRRPLRAAGIVVAVLAATLTAISAATGAVSTSGAGSGEGLRAFNAKVDRELAQWSAKQRYQPPATGPKAQKGKKVFVIPCAMVAQGCADSAKAGVEAARALGWQVTLIDPAGDPTKMNDAVAKATSQKADGIYFTAIDSLTVKTSLQRAKKAGIRTVCFACNDPDRLYDVLVPYSPRDNYVAGYMAMAVLYKATNRDLKVIMVNGPEYGIATDRKWGRQPGARKFISDCKKAGAKCDIVAQPDILTANLTTTVPGQIVSVARSHPEANALWGFADPTLAFIIPALGQAAIKVEIAGVDPIPYNFDLIRAGKAEAGSAAEPLTWVGYGAMDELNRMFAGQKPVDENIHPKLITRANVPKTGVWNGDIDVKARYLKLWAVGTR